MGKFQAKPQEFKKEAALDAAAISQGGPDVDRWLQDHIGRVGFPEEEECNAAQQSSWTCAVVPGMPGRAPSCHLLDV